MKYAVQAVMIAAALLLSPLAQADTKAVAPRADLVSVMTDTRQALVKDKDRGSYVVVKVGDTFQGYRVTSIQVDQLVLSKSNQHFLIPLARKGKTTEPKTTIGPVVVTKTSPTKTSPSATLKKPLVLINPYPPKKPLTTVVAPPGLRFDPVKEARKAAEDLNKNKRIASVKPAVVKPTLTKPTLSHKSMTIKRAEFDKAVADFTALAKEVQFKRDGKSIAVLGISRGSYFYRLGLRKGDRILNVDGKAIASMDDAAALYARLMAARDFSVALERAKHRITLRYSFAK